MDNSNMRNMVLNLSIGQHKLQCSSIECQTRKKKNLKTLSVKVDVDGAVYFCHHCNFSGQEFHNNHRINNMTPIQKVEKKPLSNNGLEWLKKRGISEETANTLGIKTCTNYIQGVGQETECVMFPYTNRGQVYASKIRSISEKGFACSGSPQSFFNLDRVDTTKPLIICEGELDALSFIECGAEKVASVVSVPNGAVMKVVDEEFAKKDDTKFRFLTNAEEMLEEVGKVIIATDNDSAGKAMAEEMARRIGKHKCFKIEYPDGCKDANDVLLNKSTIALFDTIDNASAYPVSGLYDASQFYNTLDNLYSDGFGKGESTGFDNVDELYTVVKSQLTIVTGHPSSGKSEFIDQLMVNLAIDRDWKFAVASFENQPEIHMAKIISKYKQKPFFQGANPRMTKDELEDGKAFIKKHFYFIHQRDGSLSTIDSLLERIRISVLRYGTNAVIIDPYNYIMRPTEEQETTFVSSLLSKIRVFAQTYDVHVWLIAHPTKMMRDNSGKVPAPMAYDISGSAHFFSKTDCGLTVHRPDPANSNITEIHCWKCRYSWVGKQGQTILSYDSLTSTYKPYEPYKNLDEFLGGDTPDF